MNSDNTPTASIRCIWLTIVIAMAASLGIYPVIAFVLRESMKPSGALFAMRTLLYALAGLFLLASIVLSKINTRSWTDQVTHSDSEPSTLPTPQAFITSSIIRIALAEACAIIGFVLAVLGIPFYEYLFFAIAPALVILGLILPFGLRYWDALEKKPD